MFDVCVRGSLNDEMPDDDAADGAITEDHTVLRPSVGLHSSPVEATEEYKRNMSHDRTHTSAPRQFRSVDTAHSSFIGATVVKRNRPYEPNMRVVYHVLSKSVLVTFRGEITMLGPFVDRDEAVEAAEDYCRERGWKG